MVRRPNLGVAALALSLAWVASAAAQPVAAQSEAGSSEADVDEDTAAARASFEAGLALADRGEWEQASARFREALALRDSPAVRTNLAISLAESGRGLEAVAELDRVLGEDALDPGVRQEVEARRTALLGELGRLRIDVRGDRPDTRVTVDGEPWQTLGEASVVQPGTFTVRLAAEDRELDSRETQVLPGGDVNVVFSLLDDGTAGTDSTPLIVGLVAGAVLAVAGGVALTIALLPSQDLSEGDFDTPVLEIGE